MKPRILNYKNDSQGVLDSVEEIKWDDIPTDLQCDILVGECMEEKAKKWKKHTEDRLSALFN